ncbi:HAD family phosphatase [Marinomonas sp. S3726]|uniref:HAD family hydrolase n=1 Tax=Marinomonas sp. S3726 TaxID=579484 RepID=UPI0005F9FAD9|nr:HAD family phosphatase [Marinomonas sp. S3726]
MTYKVIWFDFGGVLSPPIDELFNIYQTRTGIPAAALKDVMTQVATDMGLAMLSPIENALISEAEWGAALRQCLHTHYPNIDTSKAKLENFGEQWFSNVSPNQDMVDEFIRLKEAGYQVGILTNNVVEWEPYWKAMLGLDDIADFIIDSCKERRRKPEPEFFYLAEKQTGYAPSQMLLIDDLKINCEAASSRGWGTVHFKETEQALLDLKKQLNSGKKDEYRVA